jgi:hypothetical protein
MFLRWLLEKLRRREIRRLLREMTPEDREALRGLPEKDLILCHHEFGRYFRNGFRGNQFPFLFRHCYMAVAESGEEMSFDACSSVAIREIWEAVQKQ